MDKPKLELSDAYRKSRSGVSILSGIAVAWAAAQFEFSSIKLPVFGDVVLSQYAVPIFLAVAIGYSMMRCTTEFVMQSKEVRQWPMAQFDYKTTLLAACAGILMLAASGVSRSLNTVLVIVGIGILLFIAYFTVSFVLTMALTPVVLTFRLRNKSHTSVAGAVLTAMVFASLISGLGIIGTVALGGSNLLLTGYDYFGLSEAPNPVAVMIFLSTIVFFVVACFFHGLLMNKVFALEPPYNFNTIKKEDGTTLVAFEENKTHSTQDRIPGK